MPQIRLTCGCGAEVDNEDYDLVQFNWFPLRASTGTVYARANVDHHKVLMHRVVAERIFGSIPKTAVVDHINRKPLDNRRCNLRLVTHSENSHNTDRWPNKTSRYRGVHRHASGKWVAKIRTQGVLKYLGYFDTEEEARDKYDEHVRDLGKLHSKFSQI